MAGLLGKAMEIRVEGTEKFIAADHFKIDSAKVKFDFLNQEFRDNFLQKVECEIKAASLFMRPLTEPSTGREIVDGLGDKAVTRLTYLWKLLERQPNGESGILSTNETPVIFYLFDVNDNLWIVRASWSNRSNLVGWNIGAFSVDNLVVEPVEWSMLPSFKDEYRWRVGCRVVSC